MVNPPPRLCPSRHVVLAARSRYRDEAAFIRWRPSSTRSARFEDLSCALGALSPARRPTVTMLDFHVTPTARG